MLRHLTAFIALGSLVIGGAACGGAPESETAESSESGFTGTVDEVGIDAQVLQVWTPGRLFPRPPQPWQGAAPKDVSIDALTACRTLETRRWSHWEDTSVECTSAFANAAPFDVTHVAGPVMTPVHFNVTKDVNGSQVFVDPDFCNMIEVRVVVREAAASAPAFAGVGFHTSRGERFTAKNELQEVGRTRLVNGDGAIVYRFTGISTCISSAHSSTSGNMYRTFAFKPYAAFDTGTDGQRYRVWERINGDHQIGRSWPGSQPAVNSTGFDRQDELLAR
jgi:hypothetical protein